MLRVISFVALPLAFAATSVCQVPRADIYEDYWAWLNEQPTSIRQSASPLDAYRVALKNRGLSASDIDERLRVIRADQQRLETERWNRILTSESPNFNTQPNSFLVDMARALPPGRALDIGIGQGRNAVFLAKNGWNVTGFDRAEKAIELARRHAEAERVRIETYVQGSDAFDWGENRWDLIVALYEPVREFRNELIRALRPGGIVVIEAAHRDATKAMNIDGSVVFDTNELLQMFPGFRVLQYEDRLEQADFGPRNTKSRLVRLCAQKL